jgi:hypothetical protein
MKALVYISLILFSATTYGQQSVANLLMDEPQDSLVKRTILDHSSLKPLIRQPNYLRGNSVRFEGLADLNYIQRVSPQYKMGTGINIEGLLANKWHFKIAGVQGIDLTDSIYEPKTYLTGTGNSYNWYTDIRSRISFTPNEVFNFQAGVDHNFLGEGNRSMLLSDYGKPHPFGMLRARVWRMEYSVLYNFFRERDNNRWEGKFASSHHISFNATKWLNLGIFESVIFQPKDTLLNRGFDVEYLNPLIFYRPQEYSLGSSDNVIMGAELSVHYKSHTFYSQFILDEFSLAELRAKTGWWANKFGAQFGFKGTFKVLNQPLFYRLEYNFARPYTYSQISEELSYGNQGYNMAHPYGANFMEILGELKWKRKKWKASFFMNYFVKGEDKDGFSYGGNTYQSYTLRPEEYNHYIGQGLQNNGVRANLRISYQILEHGKLNAFVENLYRYDSMVDRSNYVFVVGIRSMLWNDYRNY